MKGQPVSFELEQSPLGRLLTVRGTPTGTDLFYTTSDFTGRLEGTAIERIRALILTRLGSQVSLSTCAQVHGIAVQRFTAAASGWCESGECDALWSDLPQSALGIKVADCLPLTLMDTHTNVVVNIHAGWRGSVGNIVTESIGAVRKESSFDPRRAMAFLGPSIRQCCFEVGEEVVAQFERVVDGAESYVERGRGPRPWLDLPGINRRLLVEAGVPEESVFDSGYCTLCSPLFHSFRRSGPNAGRNLAIVSRA
jgi:polyphenol oxidase